MGNHWPVCVCVCVCDCDCVGNSVNWSTYCPHVMGQCANLSAMLHWPRVNFAYSTVDGLCACACVYARVRVCLSVCVCVCCQWYAQLHPSTLSTPYFVHSSLCTLPILLTILMFFQQQSFLWSVSIAVTYVCLMRSWSNVCVGYTCNTIGSSSQWEHPSIRHSWNTNCNIHLRVYAFVQFCNMITATPWLEATKL